MKQKRFCAEINSAWPARWQKAADRKELEERLRASEERFRVAEAAGGVGIFEIDLNLQNWDGSPQVAQLFGLDPQAAARSIAAWKRTIFIDDVPKLDAALETAQQTGSFYVELRVSPAEGGLRWIAGKGQLSAGDTTLRGGFYEITERKALEVRLLALNETLEARVREVREEARTLELLNRTGVAVAAELDLEKLVQMVTDVGVELSHAEFGAFFYNVIKDTGEAYTLYTLSGAPREAFSQFPMPRNTAIFEPTFRGVGPVRSDDILSRPPLWQKCALSRHAEGASSRQELSGRPCRFTIGRGSRRPFFRACSTWSLH